jgi:hypothetical protein
VDSYGIGHAFDSAIKLFYTVAIALAICAPLALWKAVEIMVWVCGHLKWE